MINNNINNLNTGQPLSLGRAERAEKADEALDNHKVSLGQMSGEQLAENRDYGHSVVDNISAARFAQPAAGQSPGEFQELVSRLNSL